MPKRESDDLAALEAAAQSASKVHYVFKLVVAGGSSHSTAAMVNVRRFCEETLPGRRTLEIIDLNENPTLAQKLQVFATPTLIREQPLPLRRFVGSMVRMESVLSHDAA